MTNKKQKKSKLAVRSAGVLLLVVSLGMIAGSAVLGAMAGIETYSALKTTQYSYRLSGCVAMVVAVTAYFSGLAGKNRAVLTLYDFLLGSEEK